MAEQWSAENLRQLDAEIATWEALVAAHAAYAKTAAQNLENARRSLEMWQRFHDRVQREVSS